MPKGQAGDLDRQYAHRGLSGISKGDGTPMRPWRDAEGVKRLSWEIVIPSLSSGMAVDWTTTAYADLVDPAEPEYLPLMQWTAPLEDPPDPTFTRANLCITDVLVFTGVACGAAGPHFTGAGTFSMSLYTENDVDGGLGTWGLVWQYAGNALADNVWHRYDGTQDNTPYLIGEHSTGLYLYVVDTGGTNLIGGRVRIAALAAML